MELLAKVFGVDDSDTYPYTYQAVVNVLDADDSILVSYFADTICGLITFLKKRREDPGRTRIFEIYRGQETLIPSQCYLGEHGHWFSRHELCQPMSSRYGESGREGNCPFQGRDHSVI